MSCEWQDWPCQGKAANPRVFLDEIMISMKSDPKAALPIRAAALLHNQGLEMQLPPPELQGSLLPSAWASKFSFSLPCPHLQLGNLHSLPEFSLQTPRDLSVFMQTQPTSTKKIKLFSSAAPPRPAGGAGGSKPQNLLSPQIPSAFPSRLHLQLIFISIPSSVVVLLLPRAIFASQNVWDALKSWSCSIHGDFFASVQWGIASDRGRVLIPLLSFLVPLGISKSLRSERADLVGR